METPVKEHHLAKMHREKREAAELLAADGNAQKAPLTEEVKKENIAEPEKGSGELDIEKMIADAVLKALASQTVQAATIASVAPVQQVYSSKKDYDIDDDIPEIANWEIKDREYRLKDGKRPITYSMRRAHSLQMAMQYFNKRTGKTHTMRWSPNQTSFFIENQSTTASDILDEEIVFNFGTLIIPGTNPNLQKFLHIHPLKNIIFNEYNASDESKKAVISKKVKAKALGLVESVSQTTNRAIVSLVNFSYIDAWTYEQVEEAIYNYAESNPNEYIAYTEDPAVKIKGVAKSAIAKGELVWKNFKFYDKNMTLILEPDRNKPELDELAVFFQTSEGRTLYDYLLNLS